ncbi:mannonate dehydratase [Halomonas sp. MCCC 1A11036]|uniref:Mannonate dehydratase n=1 Tax=Billgrantia zhangzhouensis TaxID=2733481 RepID=A0ABS9AC35_9GAMM|nr:mannonate dehydratase [Halomonas zhangzhouensis]MCE8019488.1 mannonate dehydratase [Halomonas zhangzhouensis]
MKYTWRWFGPDDLISLSDVRQAGSTGVVTALHHVPNGTLWSKEDVVERKNVIEAAGLEWSVVESIPVHEDIKTQTPGWEKLADIWAESAINVAGVGVKTICYNFMPVLDWTRTSLHHQLSDGALCLRYDALDAAAFDLFVLKRPGAEADYEESVINAARRRLDEMSVADIDELISNIIAGLPGSEESYSLESFRTRLEAYTGITSATLKDNLAAFLSRVIPQLEPHGIRLAIHPDDPPYSLFGLPRVVSTAQDLRDIADMNASMVNGFTLCAGSLSVRRDNDVCAILEEQAERVHFLHLRNTTVESDGTSFYENAHLDGDVDMVKLVDIVLDIEERRGEQLPFRPDHGHAMLSDLRSGFKPGYPAIGRLRGMAEIRGVERALRAQRRKP